jgi:hypothetical protein
VTVTFNTPGKYAVNLAVSNGTQNLNANEVDYITILPTSGTIEGLHEPFETDTHFEENWSVIPKNAPNNWTRTTTTGFNSLGCLTVQNFTTGASGAYEFISQPFDASNLDAVAISFDYAYARKQTTGNEQLKVSISTDCGETWLIRKTLNGSSTLKTVDTLVTEDFIPTSDIYWKNDIVTNITSIYLTNNLQFKFTFDTKAGNNLYLDNIRIGNPTTLGLNNLLINEINCYPNPSSDLVSISIPEGVELENVLVYNLMGKEITALKPFIADSYEFSVANWTNGMYMLQVQTNVGVKSMRLIVQK